MNNIFKKYQKRLARIGLCKAMAAALSLAFFAFGLAALIAGFCRADIPVIFWASGVAGAAVFAVTLPAFYVKRFRPTEKTVARRLDALGLKERSITLYECEADPSGMAELQRQDAKEKVSSLSKRRLKYKIALPTALFLLFGAVFAAGAAAASVVSAAAMREEAEKQTEEDEAVAEPTFTVIYKVVEEGTGSIAGPAEQKVKKGGFSEEVTAVPAAGYRFAAWVDETMAPFANQNNPRSEVNVRADLVVYARFEKVTPSSTEDEDTDGNTENDKSDHETNDPNQEQNDPQEPGPSEGSQAGEGGASDGPDRDSSNNNVIDGTQDYKENFDREALEKELADREIPDELKDILGDYYDTLKP